MINIGDAKLMSDDAELRALRTAVGAQPDSVDLRLRLATALASRDHHSEALEHCTAALGRDPGNSQAVTLLQQISAALAEPAKPKTGKQNFDWSAAESEVSHLIEPAFVQDFEPDPVIEGAERPTLRLADVGGMAEVKQRLELALLGPLRNPELAKAFGKSVRGGLLLYGPPGCGKTFIARAVAGELGASFYAIGIADVLDMWIGNSERNLKEIFAAARRNAPCVLFFDEMDALGQKRSQLRNSSGMRNTVNQLLNELDSVGNNNEGVFTLAATNHPWDVDVALRRPGRFDRMLLVLPPDPPAREVILRYHLKDRPLSGINLDVLVRATEDFSGADLAHLCESATEQAMADSIRTGTVRPIGMPDFTTVLREVKPSTGPWFTTARNVAMFANSDGSYDDLLKYFKASKK